jgi:hypothetical protein
MRYMPNLTAQKVHRSLPSWPVPPIVQVQDFGPSQILPWLRFSSQGCESRVCDTLSVACSGAVLSTRRYP